MAFQFPYLRRNPWESATYTSTVYHKDAAITISKKLIEAKVSFEITAFTNGMWRIGVDRANESILRKLVHMTVGDFHDLRTIN